eukprot:m.132750 g.132750  ORF g.132750 m.132750 type:complete len:65 (+) comp15932_c0_seq2:104-298(+)
MSSEVGNISGFYTMYPCLGYCGDPLQAPCITVTLSVSITVPFITTTLINISTYFSIFRLFNDNC